MSRATAPIAKITVHDAKGRLDRAEPIVFVDSRNAQEWSQSDVKIPGAIRVPAGDVASHVNQIPKNSTIVTYCT
jgi:rhodanese-related sulfurtransferase